MESFTAISFAPLLPAPLIWALAALGLIAVGYGLARRARGAFFRLIPLAALIAVLVNPQSVTERRDPQNDIALVVIDHTLSQSLTGREGEAEAAAASLGAGLAAQPGLETRVIRVDGRAEDRQGGREDAGTALMTATRDALADVPRERRAGVVLITDGQVHDAGAAFDAGTPVHALLTGPRAQTDRLLLVGEAPGFGLVGRPLSLPVTIEDPTLAEGTPVTLTLRRDGGAPEERVVPANRAVTLSLPVDHAGANVVEMAVATRENEASVLNNRVALSINGVRDRLRVLLISGQPHAGERIWRSLLKADPGVDLVHFTILRPPNKEDFTPLSELALIAFPTQELFEEKLGDFDLVIFDRYAQRGLMPESYLANVARYVERGGAVLLAVGPEYTQSMGIADSALASVLPAIPTGEIRQERFLPRLSALGIRHPVTADLPQGGERPTWGPWLRQVVLDSPRGATLMTGDGGLPLLTLDRVGEGRVALLASDTIWLWSKGWEGGGPQAELLRRLAHWLMKEPELEEEALRARIEDDKLAVSARSLGPLPGLVEVTGPDGATRVWPLTATTPGRAEAAPPAPLPGVYTATTADGRRALAVSGPPNPLETTRVTPTADILAPIAKASGGGVHWLENGLPSLRRVGAGQSASGSDWIGLRANGGHVVTGVTLTPLLPVPLALALILGGLVLAWGREGR
ncbi:hypothetical protein CKO38_09735 [Rhodospirillum rubrum]|uniref:hypothetical protein n=1 Tax=Rhodospirillum rubrum TaxID=1085 RepID=UPI00190546FE|nr:hypothetical protein [Rhodospirillum rubrum]MBK1665208.1 hypothetical protein [Rhodospirillum rubrum]MBK1676940.1 hypothetical protein [Rhodospirillum rubrum]